MSVGTSVQFSRNVRIREVADVIAILLGSPKTWTAIEGGNETREGLDKPTKRGWTKVTGISFETNNGLPECCAINVPKIPAMYGDGWWFFYHFETHPGPLMLGGSRAVRIALHRRLVNFFGGTVDYNDCDECSVDYRRPAPRWLVKKDDRSFYKQQLAKWNLKPITRREIDDCVKFAAYKK